MQGRTLRIGVVGTGRGSAVHVPGLRQIPEVDVVAISGVDIERARSVAARHQLEHHYDDFRKMFRRAELDAVTIAAPVEVHHSAVIAAAEEGLHILCEMPIARTAAEARDMYRLVRDQGIRHAVVASGRYNGARMYFKRLVDGGYLGDLQSVCVTICRTPWSFRRPATEASDEPESSDSVLQSIGSDYIDAMRWWFGNIHAVAGARAASELSSGIAEQRDANFSVMLQFWNGAIGTIHVTATTPVNLGDELVAVGTDGMLAVRGDNKLFGTRRHEESVKEMHIPDDLKEWVPRSPDPRVGPFTLVASDWVHSIVTADGHPPSFEDGMKVQEVVDAVARSQELSRWIDTSGRKWPV